MSKRVKQLFFVEPDCEHCPISVYDFKEDDWISNPRIEMEQGDHVVIDGIEKVYLGNDQFRNLDSGEKPLWDEATVPPETLAIGAVVEDETDEPYFRLQKRTHTLAHW